MGELSTFKTINSGKITFHVAVAFQAQTCRSQKTGMDMGGLFVIFWHGYQARGQRGSDEAPPHLAASVKKVSFSEAELKSNRKKDHEK